MDHNVLLPIDLLVHQEVTHVRSLISLKLNNLAMLLILHNGTVACDTLSAVSLLNTNIWLIKEM